MPEGYERMFETRTLLTGQSSKQENRGAERHLEHHPRTVHPGDPGDVATWDEEEVLRNSPQLPLPAQDTYKGRGRSPKSWTARGEREPMVPANIANHGAAFSP